jgi:hypothetical protein
MIVENNPINGSIQITTIKFNRLITRTYFDFTHDEAVAAFDEYLKSLKK